MCYVQAMPMMWRVLYTIDNIIEQEAISVSHLIDSPATKERVAAFWNLDPAVRTFHAKTKDSQEVSSGSVTISSAGKSSKSASRLSVNDLDAFASSRSGKKRLTASPSVPAPKAVNTKGKGEKKRKTADTLEGLPFIQHQIEEYVSEVRICDP
ncbi:hypothetical protein Hanom_Chr13g01216111 [Helianthus anomalus]